jgi:membrane protein YqaA with SNARE-associated domain
MKIPLLGIGGVMKSLQAVLIGLGALGVFTIALLDAAFIPLPGGPDVVVMTLAHHNHAMTPVYVIAAIIGSTIGSLFLYFIARKGGQAALRKFSPKKRARVEDLINRYDIWALLLAALDSFWKAGWLRITANRPWIFLSNIIRRSVSDSPRRS